MCDAAPATCGTPDLQTTFLLLLLLLLLLLRWEVAAGCCAGKWQPGRGNHPVWLPQRGQPKDATKRAHVHVKQPQEAAAEARP